MRRTLKYRLYTSEKDKHLVEQIHVAASIWNHSVALTRRYYRLYGKSLSTNRLQKHIAKLRRRNPYWQRLGSQAVQDVCQRLDKAYQRFFKDPSRVGRPGFKKRRGYTSFTLKQAGWAYLGSGRMRIGKRPYRFIESRPISGQIKTVTIKRDRAGRLWILFSVLESDVGDSGSPVPKLHEEVTHPVGLDFGLKTFLTLSDGTSVASPEFFKASISEIRRCHRDLSRKQKGSRNRADARRRLALSYDRISNQRRDWFFKTAHRLCDRFDLISVEDLNIDGMKRLWGRKVSDLAFAEFASVLAWVCLKRGVHFVKVDRFYASTKTCSDCGEKQDLSLSNRMWVCSSCGAVHNRDQNAALNICREGASSLGLGNVRPGCRSQIGRAVAA